MNWKQQLVTIKDERIRKRLENTEIIMRNVDTSNLTELQKENRIKLINRLHQYWMIGKYPINTDFPMSALPYIKDVYGTPCAMVYLIEQKGDQELVDILVKTNNVWISDVSAEHDLIKWCTENGITQNEAVQIQPSGYRWMGKPKPFPRPPSRGGSVPPVRGGGTIKPNTNRSIRNPTNKQIKQNTKKRTIKRRKDMWD